MPKLTLIELSPIVDDAAAGRELYVDVVGLPVDEEDAWGDLYLGAGLPEGRRLGMWTMRSCANACFGTDAWPDHLPTPRFNLEFIADAPATMVDISRRLGEKGFTPLTPLSTADDGTTTLRLLSPDGVLIGISHRSTTSR